MAKSKHNHLLDTIGDFILNAKKEQLLHLYTEDEHFSGRYIQVKGQKLYHFGTTGYLGLEQDQRLKDAAIDAIQRYGTQFPLSKTYVSFVIYKELEENLRKIYQRPIVVTKNSTLAHIGVIPTIVRDEDTLILDHQVHASVQNASQLLKPRGISVQMVKHNNMEMLEDMIRHSQSKYQKIWYAADGVYSMYGDVVPLDDLLVLMEKYPQLHLYIDDVHGMSWAGKHGAGYTMSRLGKLRERIVLVGTLSKSFGASGGVVAFGDDNLYEAFQIFGGPQTFSAQLEPASVAAALASSKIHLSDEIYEMQRDLNDKVNYCNQLIRETDLPLVQENVCPVHFIGAALPSVTYNFARRLMNDGFYINAAIFPAVPVKNTGVRFTISRHNQKEDIKQLVEAMSYHYPKALEEEGYSMNQVRAAFKLPLVEEKVSPKSSLPDQLRPEITTSIQAIDQGEWDALLGERGAFDWNAMRFYEQAFANHTNPHHNWTFIYLLIRDPQDNIVLATFFTVSYWKDDLLAPASVSEQAEAIRRENPNYLMSKVLAMGSLITDGEHLFVDKTHPEYIEALKLLSVEAESLREEYACSMIAIRDIDTDDQDLNSIFHTQGYMKVDMPESAIVESLNWVDTDDYLRRLSAKSRKHVRKDVFGYQHCYAIEVKETLSEAELKRACQLYKNVSDYNNALNNIEFPASLFAAMNNDPHWESIVFRLKEEYVEQGDDTMIGVVFTYKTKESYCAVLLGMDYTYSKKFKVYKQIVFESIMRGRALGKQRTYLGLTAAQEKRKYGARIKPRVAYLQGQDNYKLELIEAMAGVK